MLLGVCVQRHVEALYTDRYVPTTGSSSNDSGTDKQDSCFRVAGQPVAGRDGARQSVLEMPDKLVDALGHPDQIRAALTASITASAVNSSARTK